MKRLVILLMLPALCSSAINGSAGEKTEIDNWMIEFKTHLTAVNAAEAQRVTNQQKLTVLLSQRPTNDVTFLAQLTAVQKDMADVTKTIALLQDKQHILASRGTALIELVIQEPDSEKYKIFEDALNMLGHKYE